MTIQRRGEIEKITPVFELFLKEELRGISQDNDGKDQQTRVDYVCLEGLLAIELKALEESSSERINNLADEYRKKDDWPVFYGTLPADKVLNHLDNPEEARIRFDERFGRTIANHLKKANKQFKSHSKGEPQKSCVHVLVLINEDLPEYTPDIVAHSIFRNLHTDGSRQRRYSSIDAILYISERHAIIRNSVPTFPIVSILGQAEEEKPWLKELVDLLIRRWSDYRTGGLIDFEESSSINEFETIDHIPNRMTRQEYWEREYRAKPYLRDLSLEELRNKFDEITVKSLFLFMKDTPNRNRHDNRQFIEEYTHMLEEMRHRAVDIRSFKAEKERILLATKRLGLNSADVSWVTTHLKNTKH